MAERLICTTETKTTKSFDSSLFQRRIEFHPARKPFTGFSKGSSDFRLETLNPCTSNFSKSPIGYQSSSASAGKRKPDGGSLLEHGLDPELSFGITFRRIGAGLENLGNTCFLNSVLQCLTYTEPFAAYLQSGKHKSTCRMAGFCALCAIQNHVKRALQSTGRILAPKDLVMNLRCISRSFRNARQEDAHEYMVNLLESMHKCCLPSGVPSESPSAYEKSLVHKIFGGRLRSQVKCMQCNYCSNKFDPFLDLSLEIVKADSLPKALTHFTATEQLDGGQRQYHCDHCKQKVKALKQLTVHKAPYVLTIHLKRFGSHIRGQKIDKKVGFGPTLDLKPFVSGSYEGDLKYTLYGVLVHAGFSTHSGHYYCFVRTSSGIWHSLDDNRVVQVSEKTVLQQKAYMLFYVRDRKNVAPRKPTDVKQNGVSSGMGNKGQPTSSMSSKKAGQNGLVARELTNCFLGAAQIDMLGGRALKNPQLGKAPTVRTTAKGLAIADCLPLLKECQLKSSFKELEKGTATEFVAQDLPQSTPSSGTSSFSSLPPTSASDAAKIRIENVKGEFQKYLSVPVAAACALTDCRSSGPEKLVTAKILHKVGIVNEGTLGETPSNRVSDRKLEKSDSVRSPNELASENDQKESTRNPSEQPCQDAKENAPTSEETVLAETSRKLTMGKGPVKKESLDLVHDHNKALKPKKKLMKHQTMHLGSKLSFKASLISCRKKKHKRNKRHSIELKRKAEASLGEGSKSCGLGPSTSEVTRVTALVSAHSKKSSKKKRSGGKVPQDTVDSKDDSVINGIVNLGDRTDRNNAVLATAIGSEKISSSIDLVVKQSDAKEPSGSLQKRNPSDNSSFSILTKTLVQTTVPRWDGVDSGSSINFGSNAAQSTSIGYVPDEWDEEYDRGKRKKVRSAKNTFGGPNLFQEVASMKVQSKKAKLEKAVSGNQPFRI